MCVVSSQKTIRQGQRIQKNPDVRIGERTNVVVVSKNGSSDEDDGRRKEHYEGDANHREPSGVHKPNQSQGRPAGEGPPLLRAEQKPLEFCALRFSKNLPPGLHAERLGTPPHSEICNNIVIWPTQRIARRNF